MSGFKQGSTSSPFEDNEDDDEEQADRTPSETPEPTVEGDELTPSQNPRSSTTDVPYIARRRANGESTQWQRSRITFYVRDHVEAGERELKNEVETALGEEVTKFDLREAAYIVAQENPEAVAEKLEEMGVGFKL